MARLDRGIGWHLTKDKDRPSPTLQAVPTKGADDWVAESLVAAQRPASFP